MKNCICRIGFKGTRALVGRIALLFLLAGAVLWPGQPLEAAQRGWTGSASGLWSNPDNWSPAGSPQSGDSLIFEQNSNTTMINDLVGLSVTGLEFFSHDYRLSGNPITLSSSGRALLDIGCMEEMLITCPLVLRGEVRINAGCLPNRARLFLSGPIILDDAEVILDLFLTEAYLRDVISGTGNIQSILRNSTLYFNGTNGNTFRGRLDLSGDVNSVVTFDRAAGVVVNDALSIHGSRFDEQLTVRLFSPNQIGDNAAVAITTGAKLLLLDRDETIGNLALTNTTPDSIAETGGALLDMGAATLTLNGGITSWSESGAPLPAIKGQLSLPAGDHTFDIGGTTFVGVDLQTQITGAGGITKTGSKALVLHSNNTFTGAVSVREGLIEARHAQAFGPASGGVMLAGGSVTLNNVIVSGETLFVRGARSITANTDGSLLTGLGHAGWLGRMELDTNLVVNSTDLCLIGGPVVGPGGFEFLGSRHQLVGASIQPNPSTFTGLTRVLCELLQVSEEHPFRGPLVVGGGFGGQCEIRWAFPSFNSGVPEVTVHPNGLVNLNGRGETFTRLIMNGGRVTTGTGFVSVARITTHPTNVTATIEGNLVLGSTPFTEFIVGDGAATPDLAVSAVVVDGFNNIGIVKSDDGELRLSGANTYGGTTQIDAGVVHIQNNASLGTPGVGTTVRDGATLQIEFVSALPEPLNVRGAGHGGTLGALNLMAATGVGANVVMAGPTTVRVDQQFAILSGVISGTGPFTKIGAGVLQFGGGSGAPNTYSGDTLVRAGGLVPSKGAGVTTVPGRLVIGGGGGLSETPAVVRHFSSFTIAGSVTVDRGGLWDLNGFSEDFNVALLQGGEALALIGGGDVQTGAGTLTLPPGDVTVGPSIAIPSPASSIAGNLVLQPGTHRFIVQGGFLVGGSPPPELAVSAAVGQQPLGVAEIMKEGGGTMRLSGANSFSGAMTVNDGELEAAHALALGTAAGGTFVNGNASLTLDGGFEVAGETLTLNSSNAAALLSVGPVTNVWSGGIVLARTAGLRVAHASGGFTHFGGISQFDVTSITGPGGFTKTGPGTMFITGLIGGNNYTGQTTVNEGSLQALRTGRNLSSNIVVSGATAVLRTGRPGSIFTGARTVLPIGASMTVQDGGSWAMNGTNFETISRLVGDGRLTVSTAGALTISNEVSCEFSGILFGTGALNKLGIATLQMTGPSPFYVGAVTVLDGTYKVDGSIGNSPVTVRPGAILRGGGDGGNVTAFESGAVVLVDSAIPGRLGGELHVGNLTMLSGGVSGASAGFEFFGPSATGGDDRLIAGGTVNITDTRVSLAVRYPAREGDVFTALEKVSAGPITGTFTLWPEGAVREQGGYPLRATYLGGDGNDFTLTVTNLPLRDGGAQLVSGNSGSTLVPDDCSELRLVVTNRGAVALAGLHGTLRSLTPGVVVTRAESAFPNLPLNARGTNVQPFQIRTEPSFSCGASAELELVLTGASLSPMAVRYSLPGSSGHALEFNGSGNYVAVPHAASLNAFPFTVTMWVKTVQSTAGLVTKFVTGSSNGWSVFLRGGNVRAFYFRDNVNSVSGGGDGLNGGFVADGEWHHIAFTVNNSLLNPGGRLYVDGVQKEFRAWSSGRAGQQPGPPTTTQEMRLGKESGAGLPFDGLLDEISVWHTALSVSQIQTNMRRGLTGNEANLLAYYRCNEGAGPVVADSAPSAANNNGAWVGAPLFVLSGVGPFSVPGETDCNSGGGACESCFIVSGRFNTNALESVRRLVTTGQPSICDPPKPCPGFEELPDAPVRHVLHQFTNSTAAELCVTAQLRFDCPGTPPGVIGVAAYLGEFRINQPCSSFLGDDGAFGPPSPPFSFRVPPKTNIVLVVTARATNFLCESYSLELFGLPCPPPNLHIAKDATSDKVLLQWSSAYPDFRLQSASALNTFGPAVFNNVPTPPVLSGGKFAVTNSAASARQFFQLTK